MAIYSESDLVVPALVEIERRAEGIETASLLIALRRSLRPEGDDLLPLEGRTDDRFSQKVRNLKSHNTLERQGLASFDEVSRKYRITDRGRRLAKAAEGVTESLVRQGFSAGDRQVAQDRDFEGIVVEEGSYRYLSTRVLQRSRLLREAAVQEFADASGSIECKACELRAEDVYGPEGRGLIEIHHKRPLYLQAGQGQAASIREALSGVVPLCPSCHRMVHFNRVVPLSIEELKVWLATARAK